MRAVARSVAAARLVVADKVVEVPTMERARNRQRPLAAIVCSLTIKKAFEAVSSKRVYRLY